MPGSSVPFSRDVQYASGSLIVDDGGDSRYMSRLSMLVCPASPLIDANIAAELGPGAACQASTACQYNMITVLIVRNVPSAARYGVRGVCGSR